MKSAGFHHRKIALYPPKYTGVISALLSLLGISPMMVVMFLRFAFKYRRIRW
jgi:hypothetical protein